MRNICRTTKPNENTHNLKIQTSLTPIFPHSITPSPITHTPQKNLTTSFILAHAQPTLIRHHQNLKKSIISPTSARHQPSAQPATSPITFSHNYPQNFLRTNKKGYMATPFENSRRIHHRSAAPPAYIYCAARAVVMSRGRALNSRARRGAPGSFKLELRGFCIARSRARATSISPAVYTECVG